MNPGFGEESKGKDLHRVVEHPADSTIRLLEKRSARRVSNSPSEGEGKRILFLRRSGPARNLRMNSTFACEDSIGAQNLEPFKDSKEKLKRESIFMYAGKTQGKEFAEERRKG